MAKLSVLNTKGEKVKDITLNADVWEIVPNDAVLFDAIRLTRNSQRQGTHETKTRSEVSGGGRKPWRQKGTGRARQGSIRAPHWYHGGVVFGPQTNRNYTKKQNRKERRLALKSALAYKEINKELIVVEDFNFEAPKTKEFVNITKNLKVEGKKTLLVLPEVNKNVYLSARNLKSAEVMTANTINAYKVLNADVLVISEKSLETIDQILAK